MNNNDICEKLILKVRDIFKDLKVEVIENRPPKKTYEDHHAFKKSERRTYLYIQFCNKVKPEDNSNICFRFLKGYDSSNWFKSGNHSELLIKWRDSMFKHWSEEQGYSSRVREQAKATEQYAFRIEPEDLLEQDFSDTLKYLIFMSIASIERDTITFEKMIK